MFDFPCLFLQMQINQASHFQPYLSTAQALMQCATDQNTLFHPYRVCHQHAFALLSLFLSVAAFHIPLPWSVFLMQTLSAFSLLKPDLSEFCSDFRDTTPQAHAARGLPQHTKVSHVRYLPDIFSASDHTKEPHQTPVLSCRQPKAP